MFSPFTSQGSIYLLAGGGEHYIFQNFPGKHAPDPLEGLKHFLFCCRVAQNFFKIDFPPNKKS